MKTLKMIICTAVLCLAAVSATAQQDQPFSIENGNLFITAKNKPLFEVIKTTDELEAFGAIEKMFINSKDELVIHTEKNNLLTMDLDGNIKALKYKLPCADIAVGRNEYVYALTPQADGASGKTHQILRFTSDLKYDSTITLSGFEVDYWNLEFAVADNGDICLFYSKHNKRWKLIGTDVFWFSSKGKLKSKFSLPAKQGEYTRIVASPDNEIVLLDNKHKEVEIYSQSGSFIRAINISASDQIDLEHISLTRRDTLMVSTQVSHGSRTITASELSLKGESRATYSLTRPDGYARDTGDVLLTSNGDLVTTQATWVWDSYQTVSMYDSEGNFLSDISSLPRQTFPTGEADETCDLNFKDICQGKGNTLWGLGRENITNFTYQGKILKSFPAPDETLNYSDILMDKEGRILLLDDSSLSYFASDGELLKEIDLIKLSGKTRSVDFALRPDGNILIAQEYGKYSGQILELTSEGKLVKFFARGRTTHIRNIAVDPKGKTYILFGSANVSIYGVDGKYLPSPDSFPNSYSNIAVGRNGNLHLLNWMEDKVETYSPSKVLLGTISYYKYVGYSQILMVSNDGRLIMSGNKSLLMINNQLPYTGKGNAGIIKGFIEPKGKIPMELPAPNYVYLEGKDPKGVTISAMTTVGAKGEYLFKDIPLGSQISLWADSTYNELVEYKKPGYAIKFNQKVLWKNFAYKLISKSKVFIRGKVITKAGAPLAGVTVKSGKSNVVTDLNGQYAIAVKPGSHCILTVSKVGTKFKDSQKDAYVENRDVSHINFIAKK